MYSSTLWQFWSASSTQVPPAFFIPVPRTDCAFNALLIRTEEANLSEPLSRHWRVVCQFVLCRCCASVALLVLMERQNKLTAKIPQVICTEKQIRRYVLPNLYPVRLLHCQSSKSTTSIEHTFRPPWCWCSPVALPLICKEGHCSESLVLPVTFHSAPSCPAHQGLFDLRQKLPGACYAHSWLYLKPS